MANRARRPESRRTVRKRTGNGFDFAQRFRSARNGLGLTQEDVATRAKLTSKFLSEVENGHSSPTIGVVVRMVVDGLGISLGEFFSSNETPKDDVARIRALLADKPVSVKRRALALVRALCSG
jgi:transcriptional regulator with XRE-family HTH domain